MSLFDRNKIAYTKISIEPGDKGHRYITEQLGYTAAPVIVRRTRFAFCDWAFLFV